MGSAEDKTWLTAVCASEEGEGKSDEKSSGERGIYRDEDPKCSQVGYEMLDSLRATPIRACKKMSVLNFSPCMTFCYFLLGCKKKGMRPPGRFSCLSERPSRRPRVTWRVWFCDAPVVVDGR